MNCETCKWYRYPMLTDNSLNTKPIPTIITDLRRCERGWCERERKVGQWIFDQKSGRHRCSECLAAALKTDDGQENLSDYCPVCGAKMEGGES